MKPAQGFDGLSFDPSSLLQDGLAAPEADVGRCQILLALAIAPVVAVRDECIDPLLENGYNERIKGTLR
ncbi:hypothetical protein ACVC7O_22180 (plasmid) [Roseobacter sp. A03A-229]